jgi:hypothetical protein
MERLRPEEARRIRAFHKAWAAACAAAGCPGRIPHDLRLTAVRNMVRRGVPERVAMALAGHKTRSVFERYNIVSECDLVEAAQKLSLLQPVPPASIREEGLPAEAAKSARREGGHNSGTVSSNRGPA